MLQKIRQYRFLFEELVSRDFKQKYKRTVLGMFWSVLSPLLNLLIMHLIFSNFFGATIEHYTIYLFAGNIIFSYYSESTNGGMCSLLENAHIFTKVNVPKYLFLLSKNISALINFGLTLIIFFIFCIFDGITFGWHFLLLIFPIVCLVAFNIGFGLILSAAFVFFRDISYLFGIFNTLLCYLSAIFYQVDVFPEYAQKLFYINPIYCYITYVRTIVISGTVPSLALHALCFGHAIIVVLIGAYIYKHYNHRFLYYV